MPFVTASEPPLADFCQASGYAGAIRAGKAFDEETAYAAAVYCIESAARSSGS
jgi:hypothetical protein